jgi:hypothetical protein
VTAPTVSPLAAQVYADLWPLAVGDEDRGWALLLLIGLLAQPFAEVDELVGETNDGPGWSILFDVDRTPGKWLAFPAALIGARPAEGLTDDQRRNHIKEVGGVQRGTPAAIQSAARAHLSGMQRVTFLERDGGAWRDTLITYTAETPDPAAVVAAITDPTIKPAGRKITHRVDPGWTVGQLEAAYSTRTVGDIEAGFATVGDLESNLPI